VHTRYHKTCGTIGSDYNCSDPSRFYFTFCQFKSEN